MVFYHCTRFVASTLIWSSKSRVFMTRLSMISDESLMLLIGSCSGCSSSEMSACLWTDANMRSFWFTRVALKPLVMAFNVNFLLMHIMMMRKTTTIRNNTTGAKMMRKMISMTCCVQVPRTLKAPGWISFSTLFVVSSPQFPTPFIKDWSSLSSIMLMVVVLWRTPWMLSVFWKWWRLLTVLWS